MKNIRLRLLSNFVIFYMLVAFAWWSILLFNKNKDAFEGRAAEAKMVMIAEGLVQTDAEFFATQYYKDLETQFKKDEWQIMGEAIVYVLSLVVGIWLINQGYNRKIEASQQRRNFLLSITHELKSPLASIKLVLETFQKRNLNGEQIQQLSKNALKETERLNDLVNDLLMAAKVENAYSPYLESIHLQPFLLDIINRLQNKYPTVQFKIRQPDEATTVKADKAGLTSVVVNLLENAVKYGAENPIISTVLRPLDQQNMILEFADNGIGIPDKEKAKIFERFYRVGNEDTRKTKGTGLGLYIVNQIVLAHKGTIKVTNNNPRGTIFTVSLPLNDV